MTDTGIDTGVLPFDQAAFTQRVFDQTFRIWITPEVERRQGAGTLPKPFNLFAAQVVFSPQGGHVVRLNEEVKAKARVRVSKDRPFVLGQLVRDTDIEGFEAIELTDDDPDAGHITVVRVRDSFCLTWNTRYNAALIGRHAMTARQFLDTARFSLGQTSGHAFMENLFGAVELMAKGLLLDHPDDALMSGKTHGIIKSRLNQRSRFGSIEQDFAQLYNELIDTRRAARYLEGNWVFDPQRGQEMMEVAERMWTALEEHRPRRRIDDDTD